MTEQILGALRQITSPIRPWYVLASVVALAAMVMAIEFREQLGPELRPCDVRGVMDR
jgi:hypothetical protein